MIDHICLSLGTEPGSKAYRLYDPRIQKIVISRDVMFVETKGWNWSHFNSEQGMDRSFRISLSEFGNHVIQERSSIVPSNKEETEGDSSEMNIENNEESQENYLEDENEYEQEEPETTLRKSQRQSSKPKYLDKYVLLAEEEGEYLLMCLNHEPRDSGEARESRE